MKPDSHSTTISTLTPSFEKAWDEYVNKSDKSTLYHLLGWRDVYETTYKHQSKFLIAVKCDNLVGVLPLFVIKRPLIKNYLVSGFFGSYESALADSPKTELLLINEAKRLTAEQNAGWLEIKSMSQLPDQHDLKENKEFVTFKLRIEDNEQQQWQNLDAKMKNLIRKGQKQDLKVSFGQKHLQSLCKIISTRMLELGTPYYGNNFFKQILLKFPQTTEIITLSRNDIPISAGLLFSFKNILYVPFAGSLSRYFDLSPNNLLYWEIIKYAIQKKLEYLDFGRSSRNSGTFEFKRKWGGTSVPLHYSYWLNTIKKPPEINQKTDLYRLLSRCWRLLPLPIANKFGPNLIRLVP